MCESKMAFIHISKNEHEFSYIYYIGDQTNQLNNTQREKKTSPQNGQSKIQSRGNQRPQTIRSVHNAAIWLRAEYVYRRCIDIGSG